MTGHFANNTFCCLWIQGKDPSTGEMLGGIRFAISQHLNVHTIFSNLGALSLHQWQLIGSLGLHRKIATFHYRAKLFGIGQNPSKSFRCPWCFPWCFGSWCHCSSLCRKNTSPLIRRWIHRDWFSAKICRSSF